MKVSKILREVSWSYDCVVETAQGKRFGKILKYINYPTRKILDRLVVHYNTLRSKPLLIVPNSIASLEDGRICLVYDLDPEDYEFSYLTQGVQITPAQVYAFVSLIKALLVDRVSNFHFVDLRDFISIGLLLHLCVPPPLDLFSSEFTQSVGFNAEDSKYVVFAGRAAKSVKDNPSVTVLAKIVLSLLRDNRIVPKLVVSNELMNRLEMVSESKSYEEFDNDILKLEEDVRLEKVDSEMYKLVVAKIPGLYQGVEFVNKIEKFDDGIFGIKTPHSRSANIQVESLIRSLYQVKDKAGFGLVIHAQSLEELLAKYMECTKKYDLLDMEIPEDQNDTFPRWVEISEEIKKHAYRIARKIIEHQEKIVFVSECYDTLDMALKGYYDELLEMVKSLKTRETIGETKCVVLVTSLKTKDNFTEMIDLKFLFEKEQEENDETVPDWTETSGTFEHISSSLRLQLSRLSVIGPLFSVEDFLTLDRALRQDEKSNHLPVDLVKLIHSGYLRLAIDGFKFESLSLWEFANNSVVTDNRLLECREFASLFSTKLALLSKLWLIERNPIRISLTFLKFVRERILKCENVLALKQMLREVKDYLGQRESYGYFSALVDLACVTSDPQVVAGVELPSGKIYRTLRIKRYLLIGEAKRALEELSQADSFESSSPSELRSSPSYPMLRDALFKVLALSMLGESTEEIISRLRSSTLLLKEKTPHSVYLKINLLYFLATHSRDTSDRIRLLKYAETLSLKSGVLSRLPEIYNSISISIGSLSSKIAYLKKAVSTSEKLWLPRKALNAKANLSLHALSVGDISTFEENVRQLLTDSLMLKDIDRVEYANFLLALYHAYNFDVEKAERFLKELEKERTEFSTLDRLCVLMILRKFEKMKQLIQEVPDSVRGSYENFLRMLEAVGTPNFPERWFDFCVSQEKYYREEVLSIFAYELAQHFPYILREELELLQRNFFSNGELLPQALLDEAWGHYYRAIGNLHSAARSYHRAIRKFARMRLNGAAKRIFEENKDLLSVLEEFGTIDHVDNEDVDKKWVNSGFFEEVTELVSTLTPFLDMTTYLRYFALRIEKLPGINGCEIRLRDDLLDEEWRVSTHLAHSYVEHRAEGEAHILKSRYKVDYKAFIELKIWFEDKDLTSPNLFATEEWSIFRSGLQVVLKNALRMLRSLKDTLTGLFNRYYLEECLRYFFLSARRLGRNFVVIFGDLDNLKEINDRYGHLAGDEVLRKVSRVLKASVRSSDIVARYGGDEFAIIVPDVSIDEGVAIAERLRLKVSSIKESPLVIHISFGVAEMDSSIRYPTEPLELADLALYKAKRLGKNTVVTYKP